MWLYVEVEVRRARCFQRGHAEDAGRGGRVFEAASGRHDARQCRAEGSLGKKLTTPDRRRAAALAAMSRHDISQRRACRLTGRAHRSPASGAARIAVFYGFLSLWLFSDTVEIVHRRDAARSNASSPIASHLRERSAAVGLSRRSELPRKGVLPCAKLFNRGLSSSGPRRARNPLH
jgi:hypothetical protein